MSWLVAQSSGLWEVAAKAVLIYCTALVALRLGERRTLAQWTLMDFATAVAMGAIIGRTAVARSQSYVTGAVAVCTLVVVHRTVSVLRFRQVLGKLVDHRVRVLVADGNRRHQLWRCGVTEKDLFAQLRERGVSRSSTLAAACVCICKYWWSRCFACIDKPRPAQVWATNARHPIARRLRRAERS